MTLVSDGCDNSDSVVDKKPGCKATRCLFVKRKKGKEQGRTQPRLELDASSKGEKRGYKEPGEEEEMQKPQDCRADGGLTQHREEQGSNKEETRMEAPKGGERKTVSTQPTLERLEFLFKNWDRAHLPVAKHI